MVNPGIVFLLICVGLLTTAIIVHVSSTNLVLPISPFLSLLPVLLPILGTINAFYYPRLLFNASHSLARAEQLFPTIIQTLQGILTTALAVLFLQSALTGDDLNCALSTSWQRMFAGKDESSIRRIQDSLDCCGLNSVKDRAWPFTGNVQCAERFSRDTPCVGPWREATVRNSAIDLGIVLAVGVLQVLTLLFMQSASNWRHAWWAQGWRHLSERPIEERERTRPLLTASAAAAVANNAPNDSGDESDVPVSYRDLSPRYGTTGEGHRGRTDAGSGRIEPSSLRNVWEGD
ncbi:tetraspanin Tsp3 [Colletotrichum tofieldiae]|uniref:Tetraspanin Tsp3 n=1 Tax=Colletotrichum tofieldiae TaxID=708197 RepID=A0A166TSX6_9PEZI|nr:tetraspanin Tsp3 [Colletotrichum tofieldiae]GKT56711.1 tetraspanin Tsp3 [Colletotrichum tofieldiae]GKT76322.1 tetraspanin Tsp3 [Colletotrichum tofieldiae]GKT87359.1 tetraspanin Tsp3 [Colletotrichum tofieldiae]